MLRGVTVRAVGVALELGILGPFEVRIDGGPPVAVGGVRQRALLAVLALHANEVVSTDRLVDELWGEKAPATAVHTVQVFVSRLRSALDGAGKRLVTRPPGYVLELGVDEVDAARCERLYEAARSALDARDAAVAAELLGRTQALWRGPPLADFTYEPFAQAAIARLEELRISCREELVEAQLALGRHAEVVSDLEALVREQPFRERPRGQLMLALYRSGRQADALEEFQRTRRMLVEALAVEPGAVLREMEQAILRQDESLSLPAAKPGGADNGEAAHDEPASPAVAPPVALVTRMVRKTATVLVGRLAIAGPADPEMARRAIALARKQAGQIVAKHGGAFVGALGSELVWVFGVPLVKEDDALRALRAAEELRTDLRREAAQGGPRGLIVRLGLATGEVVAETASDVFGEPLNQGLALTQAAEDGEVLLCDATRRLTSGAVRVEPAFSGGAWRLLGQVDEAAAAAMGPDSPIVGRDEELAAALRIFGRAAPSGEAHLLTVVGEAGIGKSRFALELAGRLTDRATVLSGRCLSYGEGIALWPLREALMKTAGGESREALRALLADAEDADVIADTIAMSLGLAPAESVAEQMPWAFRRLLEALAAERPLLLVVEDAHWADDVLLDLIDYLIDWLKAPALVLCLARPELLDTRPAWGGGRARVSSLLLPPLGDADAQRLLDRRLGGDRHLSATERVRILETAEGNPLFVEQLLQTSAEDPWWDRAAEIPGTIQSVLAARLDRLGPGERAFVERAAVIGREFWLSAVIDLLPVQARPSASQHLRSLVHRGLILPAQSILAGEEQLRFHHILIRDVAYRSTPKSLRAELHERFAGWLELQGDRYDEFIGYHLEQAFQYRSELADADAEAFALAEKAGNHFAGAGRRANARGDANTAIKLLSSAEGLFEAGHVERPDVRIDLGTALVECGRFDEAEQVLQKALAQAGGAGAEAVRARVLIELSYLRTLVETGVLAREMEPVAERAIRVFSRLGDDEGLSRAWRLIADVKWNQCRCAEMEEVLRRALKHADRAGHRRERPGLLTRLALATAMGPRPVEAGIRRCEAILEEAEDNVKVIALAETLLAFLDATQGRFDQARARWRQTERRLDDVGLPVTKAILQMYPAFIELMAGSPEKAQPALVDAYAVLDRLGERNRLATTSALLARIAYALGRYEEAERYSLIARDASSDDDIGSQVLWRGTWGKTLARMGEVRQAEDLVDSGVAMAGQTDMLMAHGDALCDRAEVLSLLNRSQETERDLRQALALYELKGAQVSVDGVRASLGALTGEQLMSALGSDSGL